MNVIDKLKEVSAFLESKGIEDSAKEAELLITETLKRESRVEGYESGVKEKIYAGNIEISDEISRLIDSLAERRAEGEPIQYIIGHVDFYGLKINVGRGVLIPRPETELLAECIIKKLRSLVADYPSPITVLDLCTGSGCIALAIAKHLPQAIVRGIDRSQTAIDRARTNAIENKVDNVKFEAGDLFKPVKNLRFDCIVSNPPYIKTGDIPALQKEIKDYEPIEALDGGEDGLDFYRRIFNEAPDYLKEGSMIMLEIGFEQADDIAKMASEAGFKQIEFIKDYAGIKRIFIGCRS
jgi:release factor glutamine methyltransferase